VKNPKNRENPLPERASENSGFNLDN